jgi:hypothetical protein
MIDPPHIHRSLAPIAQTLRPNLLVSGCSFSYNHSADHVTSWPYYLRDLANFREVYSTALTGAGTQHIFNSIINEIENRSNLNADNTTVLVMWSGLSRTDVIAETTVVQPWMSRSGAFPLDQMYHYDDQFSTMRVPRLRRLDNKDPVDQMHGLYRKIICPHAQTLQSMLNIVALSGYLENLGFPYMFMSWRSHAMDLATVPGALSQRVGDLVNTVETIGDYATTTGNMDNSRHPNIDAHLDWTRLRLVPELIRRGLLESNCRP